MIFPRGVSQFYGGVKRFKTPAARFQSTVPPRGRVFFGHQLDHSAKLASVFRGIARSHHPNGFHVTGVHRWSKSRRAILRQRNAVNHVLHLIFRAARVQRPIRFI